MLLIGGRRLATSVVANTNFKKTIKIQSSLAALFNTSAVVSQQQNSPHKQHEHQRDQPRIVIVGGGITGISTAYYLIKNHGLSNLLILEQSKQPMSFTSAQSGENYRNWWPHPTMIQFTNRSIDLMEEFANINGDNRIDMTRRGYVLATRQKETMNTLIDELEHVQKLQGAVKEQHNDNEIRFHEDNKSSPNYLSSSTHGIKNWNKAPSGIDIITSKDIIQKEFPSLDQSIEGIVHIRRAGDISGYSLGSAMIESIRKAGGKLLLDTTLEDISYNKHNGTFTLVIVSSSGVASSADNDGQTTQQEDNVIVADYIVNAAGPLANDVMKKLADGNSSNNCNASYDNSDSSSGTPLSQRLLLPLKNIYHQKLAFEDHLGTIPRDLPFCIDLDSQYLDWNNDERDSLLEESMDVDADDDDDTSLNYLLEEFPGAIHCRPDGNSETGKWIKLGWAFNSTITDPSKFNLLIDKNHDNARGNQNVLPSQSTLMNDWFPEIVLRGAARLHPTLCAYYDGKLPYHRHHYGGWYSMTEENWPLIGPLIPMATTSSSSSMSKRNTEPLFDGRAFINCAPSGFGTMTACASGELCATWIASHPDLVSAASDNNSDISLPDYADQLSSMRYYDKELMTSLKDSDKGLL